MNYGKIIRDSDLNAYADSYVSREVIPELISLLVKQTPTLLACRIPYRDSIGQHGVDGLVETKDHFFEFVPKGKSYWEIGTNKDVQTKATKDYDKRSDEISDEEKADAVFVFVTPRTSWSEPKQREWRDEKKQQKKWKDIKIIDGIQLAEWIREIPAIGHWMLKEIGLAKKHDSFITPAEHWEIVQGSVHDSDPALPPDVFTIGRENACAALHDLFTGKNQRLLLLVDNPMDVMDFVSAYLATLDEELMNQYANHCLFVKDSDAWHSLVTSRKSHVFVAHHKLKLDGEESDLQTVATNKEHTVVIPICGTPDDGNHEAIKLRNPSQSELDSVLTKAGYTQARAKELAEIGAQRLCGLRRHLQGLSTSPPYTEWDSKRFLAQAQLVGAWDGNNKVDLSALEKLLGKAHGEWIENIRPDTLRSDTPLIQRNEKWKIVLRGEAWNSLGSLLTDDDLDRFKDAAIQVLGELNPIFDLPQAERMYAGVRGQHLKHSHRLRKGLAETLALLGSRSKFLSSCSDNKPKSTALVVVRELLKDASWKKWASLDRLLPLLAEASPEAFLSAVENALLKLDESPFHQVFAQESSGVSGSTYTSGLLWALETLAWETKYLTRVTLILGDLVSIDPGGNWTNRPSNSLTDIYLPWHIQTCALPEQREIAIKNLLQEQGEVGWKLVLSLLPHSHSSTSGCRQPTWRNFIPRDWRKEITNIEYHEAIQHYAEWAVKIAESQIEKLEILIERLSDLPKEAREKLLKHLASDKIAILPESQKSRLWEAMDGLAKKHRKFHDAHWAMPEEIVVDVEKIAQQLEPKNLELLYHKLFSAYDYLLFEETGDFEEQEKRIEKRRETALQKILDKGGFEAIVNFAENVDNPKQVGYIMGNIATDDIEKSTLSLLFEEKNEAITDLVAGFIWTRFVKLGWEWVDILLSNEWSPSQKADFLLLIPFVDKTWSRVAKHLGDKEKLYWEYTDLNSWQKHQNITVAVEKLIEFNRPNAAVFCLYLSKDKVVEDYADLATRALLGILKSAEAVKRINSHAAIEVITKLQKCSTADADALFKIEWNFLPLLDRFSSGSPIVLENRLANDADFFCEVIRIVFKSEQQKDNKEEPTEEQSNLANTGYKLLMEWRTPPGEKADGGFDAERFSEWIDKVKEVSQKTGHFEIALTQVGHVLNYVSSDADGLWIRDVVAKVLNGRDAGPMRSGFTTELFNRRGVHGFTAGKEELELAQLNYDRADELEARGYSRFASTMREFADGYKRDAEIEAARNPYEDF